MVSQPRLRMFAGPNGSGKSTIKEVIPKKLLGVYINPDEIEKELKATKQLNLNNVQVQSTHQEFIAYLENSSLLKKANLIDEVAKFSCSNNLIQFNELKINSYFASVIASFIREKLLANKISFTFETVMSSIDKVEFLAKAQQEGYRTYLYFIATEDPQINISRVSNRVKAGGHQVPKDKIISRYYRTLELLPKAVAKTDRAYFFDNSGSESIYLAEVEQGKNLKFNAEYIPTWFLTFIQKPAI